ncbi:MAG TPA: hypothetical protein VEA99_01720, partial [Gemmatimonadaceae bacterium]|nr:hypothetical protein [Gemmatimonadaceae bacterium]
MRPLARTVLIALVASPLAACLDRPAPVAPTARPEPLAAGAAMSGSHTSLPSIRLLSIEVAGGELASPLRYDIVLSDGMSEQSLPLPEGKGYEVALRGYDAEGTLTHGGKAFVEYVGQGESEPLVAELEPLGKGEWGKLEVAVDGQPRIPDGWQVVVETETEEIVPGEPIKLRAYLVNEDGKRVEADAGTIRWFVDDPRADHFDPTRPPDGADSFLVPIRDYKPIQQWLHIGVVIGQGTGSVYIPAWRMTEYVDIAAGTHTTCALRRSGSLDCWGSNAVGLLGVGTIDAAPVNCGSSNPGSTGRESVRCVPQTVAGGRSFSAVTVGRWHACAIEQGTGAAYCWGANWRGQLGVANGGADVLQPTTPVAGPSGVLSFRSISAGIQHTCGVTTADEVFCWGGNALGQLGPSGGSGGSTPVPLPNHYASVTASGDFTCALTTAGLVECHGRTLPGAPTWLLATLGEGASSHVCGTDSGQQVWCWGVNGWGQLGDGSTFDGEMGATMAVDGGRPFTADVV